MFCGSPEERFARIANMLSLSRRFKTGLWTEFFNSLVSFPHTHCLRVEKRVRADCHLGTILLRTSSISGYKGLIRCTALNSATASSFLPNSRTATPRLNGLVFGNMPGLTMKVADHVRWYLMATSNFELHAPHWHGNTVVIQHMRTDVATLLRMGMLVADMVPDNPGT